VAKTVLETWGGPFWKKNPQLGRETGRYHRRDEEKKEVPAKKTRGHEFREIGV